MQKKQFFMLMGCLSLLAAGFSVTFTVVSAPNQTSPVVFKTPEEAITAYLEGVAQGDLHRVLQTCAINEMSEQFKFDLYVAWLEYFVPFSTQSPANYPLYVEINRAELTSRIANQVKFLAFSLLSDEPVSEGKAMKMGVARSKIFISDVDPQRLAQLEIKNIGLPKPERTNSAQYLESWTRFAHIYGADESIERAVLFLFERNYYYIGFTLLRFGENWKILSQSSLFADTLAIGAAQKTTVEEFERLIGSN